MARFDPSKLSTIKQEELLDGFCDVLVALKTKPLMLDFLNDLMNRSEQLMLARRILVAEMLINGATYIDIRERLHVGMATIARVERWLRAGRGGIERALRGIDRSAAGIV